MLRLRLLRMTKLLLARYSPNLCIVADLISEVFAEFGEAAYD